MKLVQHDVSVKVKQLSMSASRSPYITTKERPRQPWRASYQQPDIYFFLAPPLLRALSHTKLPFPGESHCISICRRNTYCIRIA
jgi:hypothetical protein